MFLKVDEFGRCYPQFVNFFEASVETIARCDAKSPRFHAFLKINQAKKECGRQTLAELLINPVQRIPRIILLLQGKNPMFCLFHHFIGLVVPNWCVVLKYQGRRKVNVFLLAFT